mmetsp:Transcript_57566/g.122435  ORF Transcript_57566/g.122435 Transcript_57566/m.122435 type:complete len:100 (+) Transcript_57566:755-1054(+)
MPGRVVGARMESIVPDATSASGVAPFRWQNRRRKADDIDEEVEDGVVQGDKIPARPRLKKRNSDDRRRRRSRVDCGLCSLFRPLAATKMFYSSRAHFFS